MAARPLVGIFVGGRGLRMGGVAKGLLPAPDGSGPLAKRLVRVTREAWSDADVWLVGSAAAYSELGIPGLDDDPRGVGPLGGLAALLRHGVETRAPAAYALACDLPFLSASYLSKLAAFAPEAPAVAPRGNGIWQPLAARFRPGPALAATADARAAGQRSLWCVLERLNAVELVIEDARELTDWDEPADVAGS